MAIRPRCTRVALSYNIQTDYTTALADAKINKVFEPIDPIVPTVEIERFNDGDILKPVEWPESTDVIVGQSVNIPFNFPLSSELAGMLLANAMGTYSVTGTAAPYTHTIKPVLPCASGSSDQLPATGVIMGAPSDTNSILKFKGVIPNDLTITADNRNRATISGTLYTDGEVTYATSYTFAAPESVKHIAGRMADFKIADHGSEPTSKSTVLMSATFSYNNNLNVDDARALLAYPTDSRYLGQLRFGEREISMTVKVNAHPASDETFWTDFINAKMKVAVLSFTYDTNNTIEIKFPKCKITAVTAGFDGIRDTLELTLTPFYDSTTGVTAPVVVTIKNSVSGYQLAAS